ncbi:unnamed protein product [Arctia plantaginis]|uniref:Uncharacterized protein n=1 Tax=Arctia plantaginis TaxID=874455 RepID=A0A8S0YQF2_ARCPL|nr:unnamed protein product [Arctia plantaginis]
MARARLHCIFVLLLYSQSSYGQQALGNNQNCGMTNSNGIQQQNLQRSPRNFNQIPNGVVNVNLSQQPNSQQANFQLPSALFNENQGNLQQQLNLPPTLQSQSSPGNQNNFQITKVGFTPVASGMVGNPSTSPQEFQNAGVKTNVQMNAGSQGMGQMANTPISISTLAELASLKGQPSLLSILNPQNNGQSQHNSQIMLNSQNQLTDAQKQFLVRSLQGQNHQGINVIQAQPRVVSIDNQQPLTVHALSQPQQGQAIVTSLGNQPAYITVQAQPLTTYLQNQTPKVVVEEEPSIMSLILSELGPQYAVNSGYIPPKKGSKNSLKALIPLIINLIKEKNNCGCRNCGCPNNCHNVSSSKLELEPQMAQIFGGYSNQKYYSQNSDYSARVKKNDEDESSDDKQESKNKKTVSVASAEISEEEDNSEYVDEED